MDWGGVGRKTTNARLAQSKKTNNCMTASMKNAADLRPNPAYLILSPCILTACHRVTTLSETKRPSFTYVAGVLAMKVAVRDEPSSPFQLEGEVYRGIHCLKLLNPQAGNVPLKCSFWDGGHAIEIRRTTRRQPVSRPQGHFRSYPPDSPRNRSHGNEFTINISFVPRNQNHRPVPSRRR